MAQDWDKNWKDAKKFFKDETGKKKPDAKVDSIFMKHHSGLEKSIEAVKKAHAAAHIAKDDKTINAYKQAVVAFTNGKNSYVKVLEAAVDKEIRDKDTKTTYSKACKYLAKELQSIQAAMEAQVGWLQSAQKQSGQLQATVDNAVQSIDSCTDKCLAAAAKVKTKPEPKVFRETLYTPARDLSQYIGNIPKLRAKGHVFPAKLKDQDLKALYEVIRPYGEQTITQKMPDGTGTDQVLLELKKFVTAVKTAQTLVRS